MTGQDLRALLLSKWGYSFDVQLRRTPTKIFIQIMWRYLEQASFPMAEEAYLAHLDEVAQYLEAWGMSDRVVQYITDTRERPRLGKAVSIPVDMAGRASEWMID